MKKKRKRQTTQLTTPAVRLRLERARKVTGPARDAFLAGLASGLSVTGAAALIHTSRMQMYRIRNQEQKEHEAAGGEGLCEFAANWDAAVESGTDSLEDAAMKRAKDGYLKPVFQGGRRVGLVREYSDTMAALLLRGRRPEKFKERVEQTGNLGGNVTNITQNNLVLQQGIDQVEASKTYLRLIKGDG